MFRIVSIGRASRRSFATKMRRPVQKPKSATDQFEAKGDRLALARAQKAQQEEEKKYTKMPHLRPRLFHIAAASGSVIVSVILGSLFGMTSPFGAQGIIDFFDDKMALIYEDKQMDKLEATLKKLAECAHKNDTLKQMLMNSSVDMNRLFEIVESTEKALPCRNYAVKIFDNITQMPEHQQVAIDRGYHKRLINIIFSPHCPLYVSKTASFTLTNLVGDEKYHDELIRSGIFTALHKVQSNFYTRRDRTQAALFRLANHALANPALLNSISSEEQQLARKYHEESAQLSKKFFYPIKSTLVDYGIYLYLHTVIGGAAWGAFTSIRRRNNAKLFARNVFRTAFITGVIPLYFVGMSVTGFQYLQRKCDDPVRLTWLATSGLFLTIYPWTYLLPLVEQWSPLWLGGHVVGFGTFFLSMVLSNNDLMRSDKLLQLKDQEEQSHPPSDSY